MTYDYTTISTYGGLVHAAYDKLVEFNLRSQPLFRNFCDKRPADVSMPGSSIILSRYVDLTAATGTLTEATSPDAVAPSDVVTKTLTLAEYGNVVTKTRKLQLESLSDVDPAIADLVAFNMATSLDALASVAFYAGTNAVWSNAGAVTTGESAGAMTDGDDISSAHARYISAKLRGNSAVPFSGSLYTGLIHPDVAHDLRAETGAAAWRDPHNVSGAQAIWEGSIGVYEGINWIETPRAKVATDGASSESVFRTVVFGKQAVAQAWAEEPHVVIGPVTDDLERFRPVGWYGLGGFAIYREEAMFCAETTSSITE